MIVNVAWLLPPVVLKALVPLPLLELGVRVMSPARVAAFPNWSSRVAVIAAELTPAVALLVAEV